MTILVAEDRPSSRELIRTMLESYGYDVLEAADGLEAIHMALANTVDAVLLDLQMPAIDGFGVLARLRAEPRYMKAPIIAVTASAMQGDRERAMAAGFSGYLAKPVDWQLLRSEIERLLVEQ
jgi:CheY-like chemotaxis protein